MKTKLDGRWFDLTQHGIFTRCPGIFSFWCVIDNLVHQCLDPAADSIDELPMRWVCRVHECLAYRNPIDVIKELFRPDR